MKLLFDQNLSPKLVHLLKDLYPGSVHVQSAGLDCAGDDVIWIYARDNDFVIVTKDEDYNTISVVRGFPPKVIWLLLGNCKTSQVEAVFRANHPAIEAFYVDPHTGTMVLR